MVHQLYQPIRYIGLHRMGSLYSIRPHWYVISAIILWVVERFSGSCWNWSCIPSGPRDACTFIVWLFHMVGKQHVSWYDVVCFWDMETARVLIGCCLVVGLGNSPRRDRRLSAPGMRKQFVSWSAVVCFWDRKTFLVVIGCCSLLGWVNSPCLDRLLSGRGVG